jgi:hypothetical protein
MSVRVVARIRPLHKAELERDTIISTDESASTIRIPNPKNDAESFSFTFNAVYGMQATQDDLFQREGKADM